MTELTANNIVFSDIGQFTDKGKMREINEDNFGIYLPPNLKDEQHSCEIKGMLAVSDGLGGHIRGETASKLVVNNLQEFVLRSEAKTEQDEFLPLLSDKIKQIHRTIFDMGAQNSLYQGMGATVVAAVFKGDKIFITNVGDSRAYLIREGAIYLLTQDDNALSRLIMEKKISESEAKLSPFRSQLTQAIGVTETVEPHIQFFETHTGDMIILCSDGLTEYVNDKEIKAIAESNPKCQSTVEALGQLANDRGGRDNITILAAKVGPLDADEHLLPKKHMPLDKILLISIPVVTLAFLGISILLFPYIANFVLKNKVASPIPSPSVTVITDSSSPSVTPKPFSSATVTSKTPAPTTSPSANPMRVNIMLSFDYDKKDKSLNVRISPKWIPIEIDGTVYKGETNTVSIKKLPKNFKPDVKWMRIELNKSINISFDKDRFLYVNNKKLDKSRITTYSLDLPQKSDKNLRVGFYLNKDFPVVIPNLLTAIKE